MTPGLVPAESLCLVTHKPMHTLGIMGNSHIHACWVALAVLIQAPSMLSRSLCVFWATLEIPTSALTRSLYMESGH